MARSTYYYQIKQLAKPDKDKTIKIEIQNICDEGIFLWHSQV